MSYTKKIKQHTLPSRARFFVTPFPVESVVYITGSVRGGARHAGSNEFAKVHAAMLLEGTKKRDKKGLQDALDRMGAVLSFSSDSDRLSFAAHVGTKHVPALLSLITEILLEPAFKAKELAVILKREETDLRFAEQNTRAQAQIELSRILFEEGHPNRMETVSEARKVLGTISSASLTAYHARTLDQGSLILSAAGDIEAAQFFVLAEKYFRKLPLHEDNLKPFAASAPSSVIRHAVHIAHKESIDYMAGVATGISQSHPDFPALTIGMNVLGHPGGFTGRLMQTVREKEGLTYGTYAFLFGFKRDYDGALVAWATFGTHSFDAGRKAVLREIRKIVTQGASSGEVRRHRDMFAARLTTNLSTAAAYASAAHTLAADGLPLSYLDSFPKRIAAVTTAQVNKVLRKYLTPELLSETAAGDVTDKSWKK